MNPLGSLHKNSTLSPTPEQRPGTTDYFDTADIQKIESLLRRHDLDELKVLLNAKRFDLSDSFQEKKLKNLLERILNCCVTRFGNAEILLLLLSNLDLSATTPLTLGANDSGDDDYPFIPILQYRCVNYACEQGSVELAEFAASLPGDKPFAVLAEKKLATACSAGALNVLQYLLKQAGVPPPESLTNLIFVACENNQLEIARYLALVRLPEVDLHRPSTALSIACLKGHSAIVQWLLSLEASGSTLQSTGQKPVPTAVATTVARRDTPLLNACIGNNLDIIKMLVTDARFDIQQDPAGYAAAKRVAKDDAELHAMLQKYATTIPARFLEADAEKHIASIQLFAQATKALEAIETKRNMDFKKIAEIRLPRLGGFCQVIREALLDFFETAYTAPYVMAHTTSPASFPLIVKNGALLSKARLETLYPEVKIHGVEDGSDTVNNEHYLVFAAMGTNPARLMPPSQFGKKPVHDNTDFPSIILDIEAWHRYNPTSQNALIVKGYDWRESTQQVISIEGTGISITRMATSAGSGEVDACATLHFAYENTDTGGKIEYDLFMLDEIARGNNYRQLIPNLLVQHLRKLPDSEQKALLGGLIAAKQDKTLQQQASRTILDAFSTLEASIAGSLPLRLDYVDTLINGWRALPLRSLRNAVHAGAPDEVRQFMEQTWPRFQASEIPPWIIIGLHDIAMEHWRPPGEPAARQPSQSSASCSTTASLEQAPADCYLAILDLVEPSYQQAMRARIDGLDPAWTARDLMRRLDALNARSVSPSQVNQLVHHLKQNQPALRLYLSDRQDFAKQSLKAFRSLFSSIYNVSGVGLQSSLKTKVIATPGFRDFVSNPEQVKVLLYLAAASSALVQDTIGEQNPLLFESVNGYTETGSLLGLLTGVRRGDSSPVNASILADLLFNVPPSALFVPANGDRGDLDEVADQVLAADTCHLFYGALREQFREAKLHAAAQTPGERLLQERYDPRHWGEYKKRFMALAQLAEGKWLDDPLADSTGDGRDPVALIESLAVLQPNFVHYHLDARHLQAILGTNYGGAKSTIECLIAIVAASPSKNEKFEMTATQLFQRMKLLEFEFYKEHTIGQATGTAPNTAALAAWDAYAVGIITAIDLQAGTQAI
jgi:hypothetical protein